MLTRTAEIVGLAAGIALWTSSWFTTETSPVPTTSAHVAKPRAVVTTSPVTATSAGERPFAGTVLGRVIDDLGFPVEGVAVFVRPLALTLPPVVGAFITDQLGRFEVSGLDPGRYSFVAIHGHHPPGTVAAVPVFPVAVAATHPCRAEAGASTLAPTSGAHWQASGCVAVDIVLDLHNILDA
jgi:hypothetical protein